MASATILRAVVTSLLLLSGAAVAQRPAAIYPGTTWQNADPVSLGWSAVKLDEARKFSETLPPASVFVVDHGKVVAQWGDPGKRVKISSVRKSLLSALYGIYIKEGRIKLNSSLAELGINDTPTITASESQATVRMLLQARSGIYHGYVSGTPSMLVGKPERGSHPPGAFWYYNNWDFNALGTIFEQETKTKIGEAFRDRIATPIQMQDFRLEDMYYEHALANAPEPEQSIHPAYHFRLSARDMARFGYLFLHQGHWNGKQIVPREWVTESTTAYSNTATRGSPEGGYAYLWWVDGFGLPVKTFSANGALAKYILVIPERDLVMVYHNHTPFPEGSAHLSNEEIEKLPAPTKAQVSKLFKLLLEAQQVAGSGHP